MHLTISNFALQQMMLCALPVPGGCFVRRTSQYMRMKDLHHMRMILHSGYPSVHEAGSAGVPD